MEKVETNKEVISGFAFHCHHDALVEWVTDYEGRVAYIKSQKPLREQGLRLKLFKMIPDDRLPAKLLKARAAYGKAGEAYDKARAAYGKAGEAYAPELEKLHKELCPDCPWNGKTIFS